MFVISVHSQCVGATRRHASPETSVPWPLRHRLSLYLAAAQGRRLRLVHVALPPGHPVCVRLVQPTASTLHPACVLPRHLFVHSLEVATVLQTVCIALQKHAAAQLFRLRVSSGVCYEDCHRRYTLWRARVQACAAACSFVGPARMPYCAVCVYEYTHTVQYSSRPADLGRAHLRLTAEGVQAMQDGTNHTCCECRNAGTTHNDSGRSEREGSLSWERQPRGNCVKIGFHNSPAV